MGNVLPIIRFAAEALSHFPPPNRDNPTLVSIDLLHQVERAREQAERAAEDARELAEEARYQAERDHEEARQRQGEARRADARAAEEIARMRAMMEDAVDAARRAQEFSEVTANDVREEAKELAREAREERERAQRVLRAAEKAVTAANGEAARAQRAADDRRREAQNGRARAEDMTRAAEEEIRNAIEAKQDAERRLKEGIQPVVTPSPEEVAAAKRRVQYRRDCFHFAVAGISGSGKSSIVNAFRGLRSRDPGAAAVGVTERTLQMARYPDPDPANPFVWYDIPGAGTLRCRDWLYFNDQCLYVFDCILVLVDNRFTATDIAILANARRFQIPAFIVRSKADQHIKNIMRDVGGGSDGEDHENTERRNKLYSAARKQFIEETRKSVQSNLEDANLPDQRVYIISNTNLLSLVMNKMPKKTIDEVELLSDLFNQAYSRRVARSHEMVSTRRDSGPRG